MQYHYPPPAKTVAPTYTEPLPAPVMNAPDGRGRAIENLIPRYSPDYENDPYLREQVIQYRRWQWQDLYRSLDLKAQARPDYLNTYRMQAEVYLLNGQYREALSQLDQILRRRPDDLHALGVSIVAAAALDDKEQVAARLNALQKRSPAAAQTVAEFLAFTEQAINHPYSTQPTRPITFDTIAVFGESPNPDGTPSESLLHRLEKAKEMARKYPNAKLILSGGPVRTPYAEADVMAKWLAENGIARSRLILEPEARDTHGNVIRMVEILKANGLNKVLAVATRQHIARAAASLEAYARYAGYPIQIDGVGGGPLPSAEKQHERARYTYVNTARAFGLYRLSEFKRFE
ncbi:ElyC/SanA/YdcF family protein [Neisseria leonii]|uniref:ElyC/SanA/YdcF family protein n=1 Tax=Neisseria leonii TaxID=2995413 RepID=UPI0030D29A4B